MITSSMTFGATLGTEPPLSDGRRDGKKPVEGPSRERRLMLLATSMGGSVAAGIGLGYLIDRHFGTEPAWTAGLGLLFLVSAMYQLIKESSR